MKMGILLTKMMALVLSTMLFATNIPAGVQPEKESAANINTESTVFDCAEIVDTITLDNELPSNFMQISCEHCHENFAADMNTNSAKCPHCGHYNDFAG